MGRFVWYNYPHSIQTRAGASQLPAPTQVVMNAMNGRTRLFSALSGGAVLGAVLTALGPAGNFWIGWLSSTLLLSLSLWGLIFAWQKAGAGRTLAWMVALAFFLRLGVGVLVMELLPEYGYDTLTQNRGYLFYDAFRRDNQAWDIVKAQEPLLKSFAEEFKTDQYGGLLATSAFVYRYLSPDVQRPFLILILGAFTTALGTAFFWRGVRFRFNERLATLAGWIMVLYPDSILFGSSQMREPFLIGLTGIALWGVLAYFKDKWAARAGLVLSLAGMLLVSSRVAVAVAGVLVVWFWAEHLAPRSRAWAWGGALALLVGGVGVAYFGWDWLRDAFLWDANRTEAAQGWVVKIIQEAGEQFRLPILAAYGLAQPVLPAAIADDAILIWKVIAIFRAAGWYALAPLLLYAFFTVWKAAPEEKRILLWTAGFVLVWLLISSIRAGGDLWDNPRYRVTFIPFMALLAGWGVLRAWDRRDWWLVRWLLVEIIFLGYFTNWYFSRYFHLWKRLPFWQNVLMISVLSAVVLGSGLLWDAGKGLYRRLREKEHGHPRAD